MFSQIEVQQRLDYYLFSTGSIHYSKRKTIFEV